VETGTYSWTVVLSSGSPMPDKGKYVHVWASSSDGSWKVIRYIVDSDAAP
jgi:ketosteroid isomerase-like protein